MHLNNRKKNWLFIIILTIPVIIGSCKYDKAELLYPDDKQPGPCDTIPASFNADVFPLMTSKCAIAGCHDLTASGGLTFHNYTQISAAKDRINTQAVIQRTMPAIGSLSTSEINTLRCWIKEGALNN
jgi:hypothetical protein